MHSPPWNMTHNRMLKRGSMYSNESISHVFNCYCLPKVGSQHQLLHCYVSNRLQLLLICAFNITFPFAVLYYLLPYLPLHYKVLIHVKRKSRQSIRGGSKIRKRGGGGYEGCVTGPHRCCGGEQEECYLQASLQFI